MQCDRCHKSINTYYARLRYDGKQYSELRLCFDCALLWCSIQHKNIVCASCGKHIESSCIVIDLNDNIYCSDHCAILAHGFTLGK